jgi:type II secretory pathway pseudopilin PulG
VAGAAARSRRFSSRIVYPVASDLMAEAGRGVYAQSQEMGAKRMRHGKRFEPLRRCLLSCVAILAAIFSAAAPCAAQTAPEGKPPETALSRELSEYPGLLPALGKLLDRLQKEIQYPAARGESRVLPLLPDSTVGYVAFPNFGDAIHQAVTIFRQERQESPALRDWWQHSEAAAAGPKVEDALEKIYQLAQFVGEELVLSGAMEGRDIKPLFVVEVRKPGLKIVLQQMVNELAGSTKPGVRVLEPQELAAAEDAGPGKELAILIRPDYVVGALDVATLRNFSDRLDRGKREFASAPFGQRIAQAYQGGVTIVGAADLHRLLSLIPIGTEQERIAFQRSGFADMKYLVWERGTVAGHETSQGELSFLGPRHGVASWLAAPARLGSLDFVSPKAVLAGSVVLKNPALILDDVQELAGGSGASAFAGLAQWEQTFQLSLKEDLLRLLGGEITVELDSLPPPKPVWKAILQVNDPNHLQRTLSTLLTAIHIEAEQSDDEGVTYHTIRIPSGTTPTEIGYAFVDRYLVVASSREEAVKAIRLHRAGESLGKSQKLLAAVPPGRTANASAMFYQNGAATTAATLRQFAPEMAESLAQAASESAPSVSWGYGEETAIREAGGNAAIDAGVVLVVAAIAIPNLLRSRMAANEASALGSLRTINTACVTYATMYGTGFPAKLSYLGSSGAAGAKAADLIDDVLASGEKSGYSFTYSSGTPMNGVRPTYTIQANPITPGQTGQRYFFTDQSGVIRVNGSRPATVSDAPLN